MSPAERWIPYRRVDLVDLLTHEGAHPQRFRELDRIVSAVVHHQRQERLERLKDAYAPFNRDADHRVVRTWSDDERAEAQATLVSELADLADAANFERVDEAQLGHAMEAESLLKLRLHVDLDDFEEMLFFRRGVSTKTEDVKRWHGLGTRPVTFTNCDRVLVALKYRDAAYFEDAGRNDLALEPGAMIIKLFQNVPRADLEMLLPTTEVRMRPIDKLIIGVPAVLGGVVMFVTKLASSLGLTALLVAFWLGLRDDEVRIGQPSWVAIAAAVGTLLAFLWRQWNKFKNCRIQFMKQLGKPVLPEPRQRRRRVPSPAGRGRRGGDQGDPAGGPLPARRTRDRAWVGSPIEGWFADHLDCTLDFDVADALAKLIELDLVERRRDEAGGEDRFHVVDIDEARRRLDHRWDNLFHPASRTDRPVGSIDAPASRLVRRTVRTTGPTGRHDRGRPCRRRRRVGRAVPVGPRPSGPRRGGRDRRRVGHARRDRRSHRAPPNRPDGDPAVPSAHGHPDPPTVTLDHLSRVG
ncbi:MAG: TMEM143 family protein [Microthrixaceae bacterium]